MNYEVNIRAENIAFGKNSDKLNNHELEKGISLANMEEKKELNYYNWNSEFIFSQRRERMKEKKNKRERKILEVGKTEDEEGKEKKKITQRFGLEKLRSRGI